MKRRLLWTGIGAAILAFSLYHPILRQVILFILPLGSGVDDLVFFIALIVAVVFLVWYFLKRRLERRTR